MAGKRSRAEVWDLGEQLGQQLEEHRGVSAVCEPSVIQLAPTIRCGFSGKEGRVVGRTQTDSCMVWACLPGRKQLSEVCIAFLRLRPEPELSICFRSVRCRKTWLRRPGLEKSRSNSLESPRIHALTSQRISSNHAMPYNTPFFDVMFFASLCMVITMYHIMLYLSDPIS